MTWEPPSLSAKRLVELGADYLAVACLDEAVELREAGVTAPILILGGTPGQFAAELLRYDITQTVFDLSTAKEYSKAAAEAGKPMKVHIKADTGMGRLGFSGENRVGSIKEAYQLPGLDCEGLFTHFADADGSEEYTMGQFTDFLDLRDALAKEGITLKSTIAPPARLCYTIPVLILTWSVRVSPSTATILTRDRWGWTAPG